MRAHADDLRAEIDDPAAAEELCAAVMQDYRTADLDARGRGILDFAVKLTRTPREMSENDVTALRELGLDDPAIHDVVQVAGLFAYYNRLADGLGIDAEPEWD